MSNLSGPDEKHPFYGLMHAMDQFFQEKPVKHFFENLDEFFLLIRFRYASKKKMRPMY